MLRYKISLSKNNKDVEIPYEHMYYGLNGNFVSFKVPYSSLRDGQDIKVSCYRKGVLYQSQTLTASVKTVKEQGYILYNRRYYLSKTYDNSYVLKFEDGKYYATLPLEGSIEGNTITIEALDYCSKVEHEIKRDGGAYYIEVPIKYYVYDGIVTIDDNNFDVDFSEIEPIITKSDDANYWSDKNYEITYDGKLTVDIVNMTTVVYDSEPSKWRAVQLVTLLKRDDFNLALDEITCAETMYSFNYERTVDGVTEKTLRFFERKKAKEDKKADDFNLAVIYDEETFEPIKYFKKVFFEAVECDENGDKVPNGEVYKLDHVYTDSTFGEYVNLYLSSQSFNPSLGTKIYATPINVNSLIEVFESEEIETEGRMYASVGGATYWDDGEMHYYITINGIEYLLRKLDDSISNSIKGEITATENVSINPEVTENNGHDFGYYAFTQEADALPTYVRLFQYGNSDESFYYKAYCVDNKLNHKEYYVDNVLKYEIESYDVVGRYHIIIKGVPYKVYDAVPRYVYKVDENSEDENSWIEMIGLNQHIIYDEKEVVSLIVIDKRSDNLVTCSIIGDGNTTAYSLAVNSDSYVFSMNNELIPSVLYNEEDAISRANGISSYDPLDVIIYDPSSSLNLPITLSNDGSINLHQEEIVGYEFVEKEINDRMNRIVDMEKDVYYPVVKHTVGGVESFSDVNEIKFHLHFRERDEDWKIIDNGSWNIMNYDNGIFHYQNDNKFYKPQSVPTFSYQDSDLLCFLNFTDNDVFYQKQKLSKSFLRISFFDSNNPKTQSLLYTATVFVNENALYKTYIDNMDNALGKVWSSVVSKTLTQLTNISVEAEPTASNSNARLSATLSIKNKYEAEESSEGFYLYIFREYSSNLRPRKIYMKVDFSHAGIGKTYTFFIPKTKNSISDYSYGYEDSTNCSKFTSSEIEPMSWDDIKQYLTDGISLSMLYRELFIPLNVKYDDISQRYIYYFDEKFTNTLYDDNGVLHLNLYELKIKDES